MSNFSLSPSTAQNYNPLTNFLSTGWSSAPEDKSGRYRLSIKDVQPQDSGTYTCASPRGLTNSIVIVVAGNLYRGGLIVAVTMIDRFYSLVLTVSQCPTLTEPNAPLSLRLEGIKLGQRAIYRCPMGFILQGAANATCLASGEIGLFIEREENQNVNWSMIDDEYRKLVITGTELHPHPMSAIVLGRSAPQPD